jgi:ribosomal protein S1
VGDVAKVGDTVQVRILEIDKEARRISLSMKRAVEAASAASPTAPQAPQAKKKRPQLRGGLDF